MRALCRVQVAEEDLQRVAQATGAAVQTTVNELNPAVLGTCETFEEVQVCMRAGPSKPSFRLCHNIAPGFPNSNRDVHMKPSDSTVRKYGYNVSMSH